MSIECMMRVWKLSESSGNDRLILLAIADEADDEGNNAFPSVRRLAAKAKCHTETVTDCLARLEAIGELAVQRPARHGRGHFNRYQVLIGKSADSPDIFRGSVHLGQFTGLARTHPRRYGGPSAHLSPSIRAFNPAESAENPRIVDNCGLCDGTGWIDKGDSTVTACEHHDGETLQPHEMS